MSKSRNLLIATALASVVALPAFAGKLGLGRTALPEEIEAWDVAVLPDGRGLPEGQGSVEEGDAAFADKCSSCHGDFAEGLNNWPVLAGGQGSLTDPRPVKTIGSYWPYLSTVFDYVHRSMPFGAAQTVSADEAYAITAFLLYSNGLVEDDFVLSKENFTEVVMPNADGFYPDDRPETEYPLFRQPACMQNCAEGSPTVTKRAIELNVTPEDPDGRPAGTIPPLTSASADTGAAEIQQASAEVEASEPAVEVAAAEAPAAEPAPVVAAADPGLIAEGEKVFKKCAACHKVGDGAKNGTGPIMNGIVGRSAGTVDGFKYSKPLMDMADGGLVWDEANLHAFLENPKGFIKGTKMSFAGLKKEEERAAVIAYLAAQGG